MGERGTEMMADWRRFHGLCVRGVPVVQCDRHMELDNREDGGGFSSVGLW